MNKPQFGKKKSQDLLDELRSQDKIHPGGVCVCSRRNQRIIRRYMGHGLCGYCAKLTPEKQGE